jgi:hypothetical protein
MIRRILLAPFFLVEPWLRHPNWMVRRAAQIVMFGIAIIWLLLPSSKAAERGSPKPTDELALRLSTSTQLQEFIHGPAIGKPIVGRICRILVLRLSVIAKLSERARDDNRNFILRLDGPIDQAALRSLLIWQNHVLPSYCGDDGNLQVDVTLVLAGGREDEARLFDLFSIALMLERFRSFAAFWDEASAAAAATKVMSEGELSRWRTGGQASDLEKMPREIISQVELCGTTGGVKLFTHGRKYANDFFKLALPARFIIAIGLREHADGTVEAGELELWLGLIEKLGARRSDVAFVVLNCLAPLRWREWPANVRFARHQGLTLQDTICLAQIADGYFGVLDIFDLAAHSAGRPGIYVPLEDGDLPRSETSAGRSKARQIMVGSCDRTRIEAALDAFAVTLPSR